MIVIILSIAFVATNLLWMLHEIVFHGKEHLLEDINRTKPVQKD